MCIFVSLLSVTYYIITYSYHTFFLQTLSKVKSTIGFKEKVEVSVFNVWEIFSFNPIFYIFAI